ncbi:MAG: protein kinase [Spirochaetes bacterium]|nr:protein kinase [Spirochaetota bacterium]
MLNKTINKKYKIIGNIGEGGMSKVYLARNIHDEKKVAVKFLKTGTISDRIEDLIRFRGEAAIISVLKHPNIVKILEIGEYQKKHYIVMEYLNGESLSDKILHNRKFKVDDAVEIVKQICKALAYIHGLDIIHMDLKPGNIIINSNVKLIDFALAQIKEFTQIKNTDEIVGTFSYMSPEQSGTVKSEVDQRSDLYSLGIIFYQMLSGKLPYRGKSISSIIHQHISKTPIPLDKGNREIPEIIQMIVKKLMEKDPDKRYQSTKGLLSDLIRFEKGDRSFNLDLLNISIKLTYKTKLVGIDDKLKKIKRLFDHSLEKNGSACLISGEAGCGKTRLSEELHTYVSSNGGNFISGKCFSSENPEPYAPFKDALNIYINRFNRYSENKKKKIIGKIKSRTGNLGEAILKLNPMLKTIIGKTPPLVKLEPERENERFLMVVSKFFQALGAAENGLVLKLQDLQWADEGSIEILSFILDNINNIPLFLIGTYRDNEVKPGGRLSGLITTAKSQPKSSVKQKKFHKIHLDLFNKKEMNSFVSDMLRDKQENIQEISHFVFRKSKGNPFFATELIKQLILNSAIFYKRNRWHINKPVLKKTQVSELIADILLNRIKNLNRVQKIILSYSAVIGKKLDISLLYTLFTNSKKKRIYFSKERIKEAIDDAVSLQLLEKNNQDRGNSLFIHDRIKEAFYKNIKLKKRRQLHLQIAGALENINKTALKKDIQNCEVLFDLAHHYIEAKAPEKSLEYSYQAGIKSKNNYANENAVKYFTIARNILLRSGDKTSKMWIKCTEHLGEIYLTTGNNDKAIRIFNEILDLMQTKTQKANIYRQISSGYFKKGDLKNCEYYGRIALKLLGERVPKTKIILILSMIKETFLHILHSVFPGVFLKKKNTANSEKRLRQTLIIQTYNSLSWSYVLSDTWNFIRTVLRMLNISESRIGKSKELAMSMGFYAAGCMAIPLFSRSLKYHIRALKIKNELGDEWGSAQSLQFLGYLFEWKADFHRSIDYFSKSLDIFKKIGDTKETTMSQNGLVSNYYNLSDYKKTLDIGIEYLDYCKNSLDKFGIGDSYNNFSKCYIAMGDFNNAEKYARQALKISNEKNMSLNYCISNTYLGVVNIKRKNHDTALKYLNIAKDVFKKNKLLKQYSVFLYFYLAQAYIQKYRESPNSKVILKKIKKTCRSGIKKSKPWPTHYPVALRTMANYFALIDKSKKAEKLFIEAISLCRKRNLQYDLAKSLYDYGLFLKYKGREIDTMFNLEYAYKIFKGIDSKLFLQKTGDLLGIKEEHRAIDRLKDKQKLISLIKVSQNISSILNLNDLLKQIISKAIEVTGAQRGHLFIVNDKTKKLEIKASTSPLNGKIKHYSTNIVEQTFKTHKAIITTNAEIEKEYKQFNSIVEYGLKSILCIPIIRHKKLIGVFYIDNYLSSGVFSDEDVELLNVFMVQAAIAIENAIVYSKIDNLNKNLELEILDHKKTGKKLLKARDQLAKRVDTLEGFLPICSFCKKIRDDDGKWNNIETYITKRSKAKFSHGLCPDCLKKNYPEHSNLV